jgi:hypothetical protein
VTYWIRPFFAAPLHLVLPLNPNGDVGIDAPRGGPLSLTFFPPQFPDAWLRSAQVTNAAGQQTPLTPAGGVPGQATRDPPGRGLIGPRPRPCWAGR